MNAENLIALMWRECRVTAREVGSVPAEAVQKLIEQTREILRSHGCSAHDSDQVLYHLYIAAHWDWTEPSARIFETLLEFELTKFFAEQGWTDNAAYLS